MKRLTEWLANGFFALFLKVESWATKWSSVAALNKADLKAYIYRKLLTFYYQFLRWKRSLTKCSYFLFLISGMQSFGYLKRKLKIDAKFGFMQCMVRYSGTIKYADNKQINFIVVCYKVINKIWPLWLFRKRFQKVFQIDFFFVF